MHPLCREPIYHPNIKATHRSTISLNFFNSLNWIFTPHHAQIFFPGRRAAKKMRFTVLIVHMQYGSGIAMVRKDSCNYSRPYAYSTSRPRIHTADEESLSVEMAIWYQEYHVRICMYLGMYLCMYAKTSTPTPLRSTPL